MRFFSAALCLLAAIAAIATADSLDDQLKSTSRVFSDCQVSGSTLEIKAKTKSGFESELDVFGRGRNEDNELFEGEYRFESSGNATKYENRFRLKMFSIVEYTEKGAADSGFQEGVDTVVSKYWGKNSSWGTWTNLTVTGNAYQLYSVSTQDGTVTVRLAIASNSTTYNGIALNANEVKLDLVLNGFSKQNGTYLAVAARVETDSSTSSDEVAATGGETETKIKTSGAAVQGVVFWNMTVLYDGVSVPVVKTNAANNNTCKGYYFSFINTSVPAKVEWDPTVGTASSGNGALASAISISAIMFMLLALLFI
jgi:hypothetical protein